MILQNHRRNRLNETKGGRGVRPGMAVLMAASLLIASCSVSSSDLPDPSRSYETFVRSGTGLICTKMLQCYKKIYRTLSPRFRKQITQERCESTALENLEWKLSLHTPEMKRLSVECYMAILDAPCHRFAAVAYWNPACMQLRTKSEEAYANAKEPVTSP